jgi:UDP-N-acetylglucosamine/UDP-N-acetylgalactosamine diphosphorylase
VLAASKGSIERVAALRERGVRIPAPEQVYIDDDVDLSRIAPKVTLWPGTRLHGARTFLAAGVSIGAEGPAVVHDSVFADNAAIASGYVRGGVLLRDAKLGANAHVRDGTLLEEEASTAHAVGLKQTILLSFVTLGSLINFCDVLMAGGTSRRDHSEVGSGFIHFNFTPWGKQGDKATPSLMGDVVHGVFLDQARIFLGGSGGVVGPRRVGFGSIVAAGQVLRRDVEGARLVVDAAERIDAPVRAPGSGRVDRLVAPNAAFLGQLVALRAWYRDVRLARMPTAPEHESTRVATAEAIAAIDTCIEERWTRLAALATEHGRRAEKPSFAIEAPCPIGLRADPADHVAWVKALPAADVERGRDWLGAIATEIVDRVAQNLRAA